MNTINKLIRLLVVLIMLFQPLMGEPAIDRKYGLDKGLNNTTNSVMMLDEEARTSSNVYYKDKKVIKRPGLDLAFTGSYSIFDIEGVALNVPGVLGAQDWEIYFLSVDGSTNYIQYKARPSLFNWRYSSDATTTQFNRTSIDLTQTSLPASSDSWSSFSIAPRTNDCAIINNSLYCAQSINTSSVGIIPKSNTKISFSQSTNVLETFDSSTGWSVSNTGSTINVNTTNSSVVTPDYIVEGSGSLSLSGTSIPSGGDSYLGMQKTVAWDLGDYSNWYLAIWVASYNAGSFGVGPNNLKLRLSTAGTATDYKEYWLANSQSTQTVCAGAGYVLVDLKDPDATAGSTDLNNITKIELISVIDTNGVGNIILSKADNAFDALTLVPKTNQWGVATPTLSPTATVGAATGLTGTYYYKCSCTDWNGAESNMSAASSAVVLTNDKATVTLTAGICNNQKYINLYRNKNGGSVYYLVTTTGANTTSYTDSTADASLVSIGPYAASSNNDNGKLVPVKYVEYHQDRLFTVGDATYGSRLYYSDPLEPDSFPTNNYIDIGYDDGQQITGLESIDSGMLIFKPHAMYLLSGDAPSNYEVSMVADKVGSANNKSIIDVNNTVYFLGEGRFLSYDGEKITNIGSPIESSLNGWGVVENQILGEYYTPHNQIWWVMASTTSTAVPGSDDVWVLSLDSGAWSQYSFKDYYCIDACDPLVINDVKYIKESNTSLSNPYRLLLSSNNASTYPVYRYDQTSTGATAYGDVSCSIAANWESKYFYQLETNGPTDEKLYDFSYLLFDGQSSGGTATLFWSFDYTDTTSYTEDISIEPASSDSKITTKKVWVKGASGNNRSVSLKIYHYSMTESFALLGFEVHYLPTGGER